MSDWKNLFFKGEESVEETPEKKVTNKNLSATAPKLSQLQNGSLQTSSISAADREQFDNFLKKVYTERNFPGPDYQEFSNALKMIESAAMDERTKFTTIFIGFSVQGVTKQKLVDTANQYIAILDAQMKDFNTEIENIINTQLGDKKRQAEQLKVDNAEIEKQMQTLADKRNKNNEVMSKLNSEINEQLSTLNIKKASFEVSAKEFAQSIHNDIQKIQTYLQ